jgi:predicted transcriptional regulator of viral defense system
MAKIEDFFATHPVFTLEDFKREVGQTITPLTLHTHLKRYRKTGRIDTIKQGLYYVVSRGHQSKTTPIDLYLVAGKVAEDSVIAFHTAFELLGAGHSVFYRMYYLTRSPRRPFNFRNVSFRAVRFPLALVEKNQEDFATERTERLGHMVRLSGKERTLVDCLERPEYCGGLEEVYRCAEKLPFLNFDVLAEYLHLRCRKVLFAKIGFFLEQHLKEFFVEEDFLRSLEKEVPKQPLYLGGRSNKGCFVKRWNLVVPDKVLKRSWEEM